MRIMQINASDIGSTGSIVMSICTESDKRGWYSDFVFSRKHREVYECAVPRNVTLRYEQGIYRRVYHITGMHYGFAPLSTSKILRLIKKQKPDIVHLHSINCGVVNIYSLLNFLKKNKIPTVLTHHAEFFYTGNCPHAFDCDRWLSGCGNCPNRFVATSCKWRDSTAVAWKRMRKAFSGFDRIHAVAVSPWLRERAENSPIMEGVPHSTVLNGVDINLFKPQKEEADQLKEKLHIGKDTKIILQVTAHFDDTDITSKGGKYLVDLAKAMQDDPVVFLVVGSNCVHDILPGNMRVIGHVNSAEELALYYSMADVCVTTSRRETFGMTVAESLCCGTPVVGFLAGGPETIALPEFTQFLPYGDVEGMQHALKDKWLQFKDGRIDCIATKAAGKYDNDRMSKAYCELYKSMLKEKG